jgi:hypothetical protein
MYAAGKSALMQVNSSREACLILRNASGWQRVHSVHMENIAEKLADVSERIAESERRVADQWQRLVGGTSGEVAEARVLIDMAAATLGELRSYKARLEHLISHAAQPENSNPLRHEAVQGQNGDPAAGRTRR